MNKIHKEDYLTLIIWLSHYYSSQWSRGYRLMSKLMNKYNARWTSNYEHEVMTEPLYEYLTANYANKV